MVVLAITYRFPRDRLNAYAAETLRGMGLR